MKASDYFSMGSLLIGIAFGAAAVVLPQHTRAWWAVIAISGLSGLLFLSRYVVAQFKGKPAPHPDLDIDEFLRLWLGCDWRGNGSTSRGRATRTIYGTHEAMDALAGAARLSKVSVWGRKNQVFDSTKPLSPIPAEAWDQISIDGLELLCGKDTRDVAARKYHAYQSHWCDIHLNRAQVRKAWPKMACKVPRE